VNDPTSPDSNRHFECAFLSAILTGHKVVEKGPFQQWVFEPAPPKLEIRAWNLESATPGYFFQTGRNSLSLKQPAALPKTPWRVLPAVGNWLKR
jgi:hypothetical protein